MAVTINGYYTSATAYKVTVSGMTTGQKYHLFIQDLNSDGSFSGYYRCGFTHTVTASSESYSLSRLSSSAGRVVYVYCTGTTATNHVKNNLYTFSQLPTSYVSRTSGEIKAYKPSTPKYNYYLRYDANGGTGGPNTQKTLETTATSVTFKVPSTKPTRTNYTFLGWSFNSTATAASYVSGDTVTLSSGNPDRTLYAVWEYKPPTPKYNYYLRYDANGGTGGPNDQSTLGTTATSVTFKIPSTEPTRTNYTFLGWSFSSTATSASYVSGDIITLNSGNPDRTLYAVWKYTPKYNYYLRYNANGGTGGPNDQSNFGTTATSVTFQIPSTKPTRTNYTFLGWSFDSTATEASYVSGNTVTLYSGNPDRTLYAVWKIAVIKPTITYVSHTDTTIKISLDRNDATTGSWIIEASLSNFGTVVYTTTITSTSQTTITLTGLTPETTYYIRARHVNGDVSASSNVISGTTRTSTFQWTSNDSVYVIKGAVFTDAITAAKWNELIKKVNWCRSQKGLSTASLNRATSGQQILATNFTAMRNAIADMRTVTPARSAGDEILATYFANSDTSLKSAINAVITTL